MKRPPLRSAIVLLSAAVSAATLCALPSHAQVQPSAPAPTNPFQNPAPAAAPAPAPSAQGRPSKSIAIHATPALSPAGLLYNAALNDFKAGRTDAAVAKLRQYVAKYPKDASARGLLGYLELRQSQTSPAALAEASRDLASAVAIDPKNQVNRGNYASALLQQKRWADAAAQLRIVAQAQPGDTGTQLRLAGALGQLGRTQEANAILARVAQSPNCPPYALIQYGITVANQQKPAAAAKLFDRAARLEPTNAAAWNDAGICYERAGDNKNAVRCLAQAVKLGPSDPFRTRFVYATVLAKLGDYSQSTQQFRYITAMQPTAQPAWFNLGLVEDRAGHIDDALAAYSQSRQLAPDHIPTLLNMCRLYIQKGQASDAVDLLLGASQAQPKVEVLHAALGAAYLEEQKPAQTRMEWQTAVGLDPTDNLTRARLAQLDLDDSKWADALANYDVLVKAAPESDSLLNQRAEALENLQRYPEALADLHHAIALNPRNAIAWNNLGTVEEHAGNKSEALADYRKAAVLSPTLAEARTNIGRLTGHTGPQPAVTMVMPKMSVRSGTGTGPGPTPTPPAPQPPTAAPTPTTAPSTSVPPTTPTPAPSQSPAPQPAPATDGAANPPSTPAPAAPQLGSGTINP